MPGDTLFRPLAADPRWPHFSAAYHYHTDGKNYKHSFDAAIGKTFSAWRSSLSEPVFSEVGIQVAAFPTFNAGVSSFDLINTDYLFGVPVFFQFDGVSVMARLYHQSSHMGDAYFKKNPDVDRVNLNYQALDTLFSFEPNNWFRLYGGGGLVLHSDPGGYGTWMYQGGVEMRVISEIPSIPDLLLALDVKGQEETNYTPSYSISIGVEAFQNGKIALEIYDGYSPNGQFYRERVTWVGLGIHLY
jgi:hypothetical protein